MTSLLCLLIKSARVREEVNPRGLSMMAAREEVNSYQFSF